MKNKLKLYIWILLPVLVLLVNFTFASPEVSVSWYTQLLELWGNMLYIVLWPLLMITWLALGNDLASGNVFGIIEMLYKFWLLMRNFAALTLVAIILYDIVKWLFANKVSEVAKNFLKYVIAGILIPASWFFIPFLLGVSNLLITWIWELPLNFRDDIAKTADSKILSVHTYINLADKVQTVDFFRFATYYSNGNANYITCPFKNPNQKPQSVWQDEDEHMDEWEYYDAIYKSDVVAEAGKIFKTYWIKIEEDYCAINQKNLVALNFSDSCIVINNSSDGKAAGSEACFKAYTKDDKWNYAMTKGYSDAITLWNSKILPNNVSLIASDGNNAMVWPLYNIYSSLLNFSTISATNVTTATDVQLMEFLLKFVVSILAIIPLAWLAILSMVRVGVIWLLMVFSPFIVLLNVLNPWKADEADKTKFWWKWRIVNMTWDIGQIIKLIFQPVVIIFGLSLWIVFLQTISFKLGDDSLANGSLLWMEITKDGNGMAQYASDATTINIKLPSDTFGDSIFFNLFQRLIMNIFGIIVMRQIWMMGMQFSKITSELGGQIQKLGEDYLTKEVRAIPVPTKDWVKRSSRKWVSQWFDKRKWDFQKQYFPDDKSYNDIFKWAVDSRTVRMSDDRAKANWNFAAEADLARQTSEFVNSSAAQKARQFAKKYIDSGFGNSDWLKNGDVSKASGVNYAAAQYGLWSLEDATKNQYFAKGLFDEVGTAFPDQFSTYQPTRIAYSTNVINALKNSRDVTALISRPEPWVQAYLKRYNTKDGNKQIRIIWYTGIVENVKDWVRTRSLTFKDDPITLPLRKTILDWKTDIKDVWRINDFIKNNSIENLKKIYKPEWDFDKESIKGTKYKPSERIITSDNKTYIWNDKKQRYVDEKWFAPRHSEKAQNEAAELTPDYDDSSTDSSEENSTPVENPVVQPTWTPTAETPPATGTWTENTSTEVVTNPAPEDL